MGLSGGAVVGSQITSVADGGGEGGTSDLCPKNGENLNELNARELNG